MASATSPDRWRRLEDLFQAACEMDAASRSVFLDQACGADSALRQEVEALLQSAEATLGFLARPVQQAASQVAGAGLVGQRVGPYRVLRTLGEGGMGTVYLAARADQEYERQVAIKVMRFGLGANPAMHLRFRAERQILANLSHPNIARLLDGGMTADGAPYLVMEYVEGVPIDEYCRRHRLLIPDRLRLFRTVCEAVECAHRSLVVHRDIKPSNILVTSEGVPHLIDFGIAKLLDPELGSGAPGVTHTAERVMTPEYASPEQVRGEPVTTATDVYALGILLYELLAGQRPFRLDTKSPLEAALMICEQAPPAPSTMRAQNSELAPPDAPRLKGELDNVVLMAIRKEPARRYASVAQLSGDITAWLDGYPLHARTDTWSYRSGKFVRRHKIPVAIATVSAVAILGFAIGMGLLARRATRAMTVAERESQFLMGMFQAATPEQQQGHTVTARDLLDAGAKRIDKELAGEPQVRASLLANIAGAYRSLGLFDQATEIAQRCYNLKRQAAAADSPELAGITELLGSLMRDRAQYDQAESMFRRLVAIRTRTAGPDHTLLAGALSDLGECLYLEGKDGDAEPVLRRALEINHSETPDNGSDARNYLALLLERKGQYPEAARLLGEAVEIDRRRVGPNHPDYATSLHNLASALIDTGDLQGSEAKLREALAIRRRVLGEGHPALGYSLNNLAYVLLEQGKWDAAEPFARENLALNEKRLGPEHPMLAGSHAGLARVLAAKGDFAGAEAEYGRAVEILEQSHTAGSFRAAQITLNRALLEFDRGRYAAAEALARQSLELERKLGGDRSPGVASALVQVGEDRMLEGDPHGAEPLLRQALEIRREKYPPVHPLVLAAQVRLGEALTAEGQAAQAEPILRHAAAAARDAPHPLPAWQVAEGDSALGACLESLGRKGEAAKLFTASAAGIAQHPHPGWRKLLRNGR